MSLSIKNGVAHQQAKELAALTGETITDAVSVAILERLIRVKKENSAGLAEVLFTISDFTGPRFKLDFDSSNIDEMLYDEFGLPK